MPIPNRPGEEDFYYHVYDYPGSASFSARDRYTEEQLNTWLANSWVVPPAAAAYQVEEQAPHRRRGFVGQREFLRKRRILKTREYGSLATGLQRYSLVKDLRQLREEAHANLHASLWYANHLTYFGRRIYILKFGSDAPNAPQVLLTGGVHGREWIAVEMPYLIAEYLVKNYDPNAPANTPLNTIKTLLESCQIWVIPMLNPDGHSWSVASERLWRRNRKRNPGAGLAGPSPIVRAEGKVGKWDPSGGQWVFIGVDCNRNFAGAQHLEQDPRKETYSGPNQPSEQETQALVDCVGGQLTFDQADPAHPAAPPPAPNLNNLVAGIDYHSAKGAILYHESVAQLGPYQGAGVNQVHQAVRKIGDCMRQHIADYNDGNPYAFGDLKRIFDPLGQRPELESGGSVMHYCRGRIGNNRLPLAFTIELDPLEANDHSPNRWSLGQGNIQRIFEKNLTAALCLINYANYATQPLPAVPNPLQLHAGNIVGQVACDFRTNHWPDQKIKGRGNQKPNP